MVLSSDLLLKAKAKIVRLGAATTLLFLLSACASQNLWQGEDVLVEARQQALEHDVGFVSEDHRALRDRFNALERLYVELVQHVRTQESVLADINKKVSTIKQDPKIEASVGRVRNDVSIIRDQLKKLENRMFSVEMADTSAPAFVAKTNAPTGRAEKEASVETDEIVGATDATPVSNVKRSEEAFFGVHLASFRSKDQVNSGWSNLAQTYAGDLQGLTPLLYVQSQEGIGTFMRLVAGPLINEQEADALCTRIKRVSADQYCRVSEYQGEPIG